MRKDKLMKRETLTLNTNRLMNGFTSDSFLFELTQPFPISPNPNLSLTNIAVVHRVTGSSARDCRVQRHSPFCCNLKMFKLIVEVEENSEVHSVYL